MDSDFEITRAHDVTAVVEGSDNTPAIPLNPAAVLARFERLRDPQARLQLAIELARQRLPLPDRFRSDVHRVAGCQVRLWFVAQFHDGRCQFATDSDAVTLKALIGLLCDLYSGLTPSEVLAQSTEFLDRLGLLRQLAESRRATVRRVAGMIRDFALQASDQPVSSTGPTGAPECPIEPP